MVHEPLPALVPIETEESWPKGAMGISLKNVRLTAEDRGKRIFSDQGELMLTHFGLSGPLALTLSSLLPEDPAGVRLYIDLKPALDVGDAGRAAAPGLFAGPPQGADLGAGRPRRPTAWR